MALILLAEDEHNIRLLIATLLSQKQHAVIEATDGHQALNLLKTDDVFDLIITDLVMPHVDGLQLIEIVRTEYPKLPVIAMSAYDDALMQAKQKGAANLLKKPFSYTRLTTLVDSMTGG